MASVELTSSSPRAFTCPVCLRNSKLPRILKCLHYICNECVTNKIEGTAKTILTCPFCDTKDIISGPHNEKEERENHICSPCESEQNPIPAMFHCVDCQEYLCEECHSVHSKIKASRHHKTLDLSKSISTSVIKRKTFCEECKWQHFREVEFLCIDHNSRCCGTCIVRTHKQCKVHDIAHVVERIKSENYVDDLRLALEDSENRIRCIVSTAKENNAKLVDQVDEIRKSVKDLRTNINKLLNEFEKNVIAKSKTVLEREEARNNEQIKTCLRFTTAIEQSSRTLDEAVDSASDIDFHETFKNIENHSLKYASFISNTLEDRQFLEIHLELSNKMIDLLDDGHLGGVIEKEYKASITPTRKKTIKREKFVRAVIKLGGAIPRYSCATFLPNGQVCLIDCNNKRCCLFDSSFQNLDVVSMNSCPWTTACLGSGEIVVSLPLECNLQFYYVRETKLQNSRCIQTRQPCWGVAPADGDNIAIAVDCKGNSPGIGMLSAEGDEIFTLGADETQLNFGSPWQFDFDTKRNRFLISCQGRESAICMNTRGKTIFEYKAENLRNPAGISHDCDGNVYVCGLKSHNIHQLNPNGELLRVIALPKLRTPFSICFSKNTDEFLVTTVENREELQVFSLE